MFTRFLIFVHECRLANRTDGIVAARFDTESTNTPIFWDDNNCGDVGGPAKCYIYDPTQQAARQFYWQNLHKGYYQNGIKVFWLGGIRIASRIPRTSILALTRGHHATDASEPEISTRDAQKAALEFNNSLGNGNQVGMMYPYHLPQHNNHNQNYGLTEIYLRNVCACQ